MRERLTAGWIYICFFLSGTSGLIYEIVWMRKLALVFGNTVHAVSTIVAVFMGGLALGSWLFGRAADSSNRPLRLYIYIELGIAVSGAVILLFLLPVLDNIYIFLYHLGLREGAALFLARFLLSVMFLLIPTVLMGGTLPVMSRYLIRSQAELGSRIGTLYGINTLGAVVGSLASGFWLIMLYGEKATVWIAAAGNLTAGVLALMVLLVYDKGMAVQEVKPKPYRQPEYTSSSLRLVPWLFASSGFAALAFEVLWTRALIYFVGLSVHAFTIILTCFLAGIALGSLAAGRLVDRTRRLFLIFGLLQWIVALSAIASVPIIGKLTSIYQRFNLILGANTWNQVTLVKFFLCLAVLGLPTLAMGAAFPVVNRLFVRKRSSLGREVGALYAANTMGTILGSLAAGFLLLPAAGITGSILLVAGINAAVAAVAFYYEGDSGWRLGRKWLPATSTVLLLAVTALVFYSGGLGPIVRYSIQDAGKEILYCKEGTQASISVLRNFTGDRELNINGESTAYTGFEDLVIHKLLAHLPILLHPNPKSFLAVGFGFGSTVYTANRYDLRRVECVELVPDEILTAKYFIPENHGVLDSPNVKIVFDDGRNLILRSSANYDVISFNAIHPKLSPTLYTLDFYRLCAKALAPGGTICAWLPANGLSLVEFKSLLRSFAEVFPHVSLWYNNPANVILLGTSEPFKIDYQLFSKSLSASKVRENLREVRLEQPLSFLSLFMMGEKRLRALTQDAPLNTDANPIIEFSRTMAPTVPLETYHWIMDNLEPITEYLSWEDTSTSSDSLAAALRSQIDLWSDARRVFYEGKFASWVFKELSVAMAFYRKALNMNPEDDYISHFLEGPQIDPDSLEAAAWADRSDFVSRYQLGDFYFNKGKLGAAKRWFGEVANIRPDHAQAWFQLGLCAEREENPVQAERYFLQALDIHPASPQTLVNLGIIRYRAKDYDKARFYFERALKVSPDNGYALFNMGNLEYRLNKTIEAERLFREAIKQDPFKVEAYLNLGALLTNRGDFNEAITSYKRAVELDPGFIPAYFNLALTYEKMGDISNAGKYQALARRLQARMGNDSENQ
ncbi:MAG TPA: fused MFS/spermidine synthase [archaeon]|nr:fused MFS/spermidine synthase [archaeon]